MDDFGFEYGLEYGVDEMDLIGFIQVSDGDQKMVKKSPCHTSFVKISRPLALAYGPQVAHAFMPDGSVRCWT